MEKFVLIDRDGVITVRQDQPIKSVDDLTFLPFVQESFLEFERNGINLVVLVNSPAPGEVEIAPDVLNEMNNVLHSHMDEVGAHIFEIMVGPQKAQEAKRCRFPNPSLLKDAAKKFGFSLASTYFICASLESLQAAWNAGCKSAFVRTGKPYQTMQFLQTSEKQPDFITKDILSAALKITAAYRSS